MGHVNDGAGINSLSQRMRNPVSVHSQSFSSVHASAALISTNNPTEEKYNPLLSVLPKHTALLLYTLV